VFLKKEREIDEVNGELSEVDRTEVRRQQMAEQSKAATLEDLINIGRLRGYKRPELWARHVFRARQSRRAA
jgi:hypothetical protein